MIGATAFSHLLSIQSLPRVQLILLKLDLQGTSLIPKARVRLGCLKDPSNFDLTEFTSLKSL